MSWQVVVIAGPDDKFLENFANYDQVLQVPFGIPDHDETVRSTVYSVLHNHKMTCEGAVEEFLQFAIAAYTADTRISRNDAFDSWTRQIDLWFPVNDAKKWLEAKVHLEQALQFLTGDRWSLHFRVRDGSYQTPKPKQKILKVPLMADAMALFSGGLDSYIGAIDQIGSGQDLILVGHHSQGGGPTSTSQNEAYSGLCASFKNKKIPFFHLWVSPPKGEARASEITTRGRSIIFLALGIVCAAAGKVKKLLIPENGFISLNVPLTPARLGSFSTRTTHPYFIFLIQEAIRHLGISVELELPYRFLTKGEMVEHCVDQKAVARAISNSMSCSHPGVGRWIEGGSANQHCGYCVPCIVRRAAVSKTRRDPTKYRYKISNRLSEGRGLDLKALKMAIDDAQASPLTVLDILKAGPIPPIFTDRSKFLDVYRRGLAEIADVVGMKYKS